MPAIRKPRFSYANITSTAALVIALGCGTAYAGTAINGHNIIPGTVRGTAIEDGSLQGKDLKPGSLTDKQIKDQSLDGEALKKHTVDGQALKSDSLPVAALNQQELKIALKSADAGSVNGKSATCGAGAVDFLGGCWDLASSTAGTWQQAVQGCAGRGGELPSIGDLLVFTDAKNVNADHEWVDDYSYDSSLGLVRTFKVTRGYLVQNAAIDEIHAYRCVLPLLHS